MTEEEKQDIIDKCDQQEIEYDETQPSSNAAYWLEKASEDRMDNDIDDEIDLWVKILEGEKK